MVNAMKTQRSARLVRHPSLMRLHAFTLIELLVVIVIIAILAAIVIPATKHLINRARVASAQNDALQLKNAIGSYFVEYRRYPTRLKGPEDASSPILSDHALMDILLGSAAETAPDGMNPRRHFGFNAKNARPTGDGRYRGGVHFEADGGGTFWDPWGNHYRVLMDLDADNRIPAPSFVSGTHFLPQAVAIWSAGKDGEDDSSTDNVITW